MYIVLLFVYTAIVTQCTWTKRILGTYLFCDFFLTLIVLCGFLKNPFKTNLEKESSIFVRIMQQFCIILLYEYDCMQ